jgi:hypothetical protein
MINFTYQVVDQDFNPVPDAIATEWLTDYLSDNPNLWTAGTTYSGNPFVDSVGFGVSSLDAYPSAFALGLQFFTAQVGGQTYALQSFVLQGAAMSPSGGGQFGAIAILRNP